MSQQGQTLDYFKTHAEDWQRKAVDDAYSLIENRHLAVLETMKGYPKGSSLLDVGCGTGQLAVEASRIGWTATGIDFAQEMIDVCRANNLSAKTNAEFICSSIFEADLKPRSFDVISAQGFIEYISLSQLDSFLDLVRTTLKPNGAIALGSRNRLFNLHTLNAFTELERALGTLDRLITEGLILQSAKTQEEAVARLRELNYEYEQPETHPLTGVKVDTRFQFSPADLTTRLSRHQLRVTKIYPVHYHPLPIVMMEEAVCNDVHNQLAKFASANWLSRHCLVPYSSSYVIEAVRYE
jgi:2-polyprenyl-3-methyl-5-hydroxy-6-metoxy-1,4-benzoquinol methylase